MGSRKVIVKRTAAESIAAFAWYIESKGMIATAEKFSDHIYDFFYLLANEHKRFAYCRDPKRSLLGYKCVSYKKNYTVVFLETDKEIVVVEFISSKMIYW